MVFHVIRFISYTGTSMMLPISEGKIHNEPLTTNSIILQNVVRKNTEFSVFNEVAVCYLIKNRKLSAMAR